MSTIRTDRYNFVLRPASNKPMVNASVVTSENGRSRKVLEMTHEEANNIQRLVSVGCDNDDNINEKYITFKWPWDMDRLCREYDHDGEISYRWLETERYEKNLTFFGSYHIGTSITVRMDRARSVEPYLVGSNLEEEMKNDINVEEVDERMCVVHNEFSKDEPSNKGLQQIMEYDIQRQVFEYRGSQDTNTYKACEGCGDTPCVWASNKNAMIAWDESEHGHLHGDDLPSNNTRRKCLYRQIALAIAGGPLGKGKRIQLPCCILDGIRALFPDMNGKYMGHMTG
jgi:hypothetical protein